jgi:hypothetical protein
LIEKVEGEDCFGRSKRRHVKNIKMDFTELMLVGVERINVTSPFLLYMALGDLGPKVRGSMVVSFTVVDKFDEEPFLTVIFDCVEISERIS